MDLLVDCLELMWVMMFVGIAAHWTLLWFTNDDVGVASGGGALEAQKQGLPCLSLFFQSCLKVCNVMYLW